MPLREPSIRPKFDFAAVKRRRGLKTPKSRDKEAEKILQQVLVSTGGSKDARDGQDFALDFSSLGLESLPVEFFEDEFLYEKCVQFLVAIDLSDNSLKYIDSEIGDFERIKRLDLSKNRQVIQLSTVKRVSLNKIHNPFRNLVELGLRL